MKEETKATVAFCLMLVVVTLVLSVGIYSIIKSENRDKAAAAVCSPFVYDSRTKEYAVCKSSNPLGYEIRLFPNESNL